MAGRRLPPSEHLFDIRPAEFAGGFKFTSRGVDVDGRPSRVQWVAAFRFAVAAEDASPWWVVSLQEYLDQRPEWSEHRDQMIADATAGLMANKTVDNRLSIGRKVKGYARQLAPSLAHAGVVQALEPDEQVELLTKARDEGLNERDFRLHVRAHRRRKVIKGQALLEGLHRVIYADPPWSYDNRPPSGRGSKESYPTMTVDQLCELPVAAHALPNAVLFLWTTAPMLYFASDPDQGPDPYRVIRAWGFEPKTGMVWDKVRHNFGNYVSVRHEHLIIATRGSCTPDRPVPMPDSVVTEQPGAGAKHSEKPETFRQIISKLYDGPYLELFGREAVDDWTVFGNDASLWGAEATPA